MADSVHARGLSEPDPLQSSQLAMMEVSNSLLVRGGAVTAAAPLSALLFVTAGLSAVTERQTKTGALVGAPLLSFGTFCILRWVREGPLRHTRYCNRPSLLLRNADVRSLSPGAITDS